MENRVRLLRKNCNKTIYDVAKDLNLSPSTIAMIERGERGITSENAMIFSKYFNVSTDYLLGLTDIRNPIKKSDNFVLGGLENELDDEEKQQVLDFATYLVHKKRGGGINL